MHVRGAIDEFGDLLPVAGLFPINLRDLLGQGLVCVHADKFLLLEKVENEAQPGVAERGQSGDQLGILIEAQIDALRIIDPFGQGEDDL